MCMPCRVNPFSLLLEAVERHLAGSVPEEVFVWVDLFGESVSQGLAYWLCKAAMGHLQGPRGPR